MCHWYQIRFFMRQHMEVMATSFLELKPSKAVCIIVNVCKLSQWCLPNEVRSSFCLTDCLLLLFYYNTFAHLLILLKHWMNLHIGSSWKTNDDQDLWISVTVSTRRPDKRAIYALVASFCHICCKDKQYVWRAYVGGILEFLFGWISYERLRFPYLIGCIFVLFDAYAVTKKCCN